MIRKDTGRFPDAYDIILLISEFVGCKQALYTLNRSYYYLFIFLKYQNALLTKNTKWQLQIEGLIANEPDLTTRKALIQQLNLTYQSFIKTQVPYTLLPMIQAMQMFINQFSTCSVQQRNEFWKEIARLQMQMPKHMLLELFSFWGFNPQRNGRSLPSPYVDPKGRFFIAELYEGEPPAYGDFSIFNHHNTGRSKYFVRELGQHRALVRGSSSLPIGSENIQEKPNHTEQKVMGYSPTLASLEEDMAQWKRLESMRTLELEEVPSRLARLELEEEPQSGCCIS